MYQEPEYQHPEKNAWEHEVDQTRRRRRNHRTNRGIGKMLVSAVLFGLIAGGTMFCVRQVGEKAFHKEQLETTVNKTSASSGLVKTQDVSDVVESVMPSVVSITGKYQMQSFFGTQEAEGAGSGFIIGKGDKSLMIATNNHVVSGSSSLSIGFVDGRSAKAEIVGKDSSADLAVLSVALSDIPKETLEKIKVASLYEGECKVGQPVIAIGNALGYGQSVTTGVISAKDREISFADGSMKLIQTDAAINPGNSGGVLINTNGEVIGINNSKISDTTIEGVGYAIPIASANKILNKLMNAEEVKEESFLGIEGKNITADYSEALGIPQGIYVASVIKGSPAETAKLKVGDIITEFDGNQISTMTALLEKLAYSKPEEEVALTVKEAQQNGEYKEKITKVKLKKKSDFKEYFEEEENPLTPFNPDAGEVPFEYYFK